MADADLMTVSEVARVFERSNQTIRDWADAGVLPVMKTSSGERIFKTTDVQRVRDERAAAAGNNEAA